MTDWHGPGKWAAQRESKVRRYHQRRADLLLRLGGKCLDCGAVDDLQFHHPKGRGWVVRDKSRWARMVIYEREATEGKIELLCGTCNKKHGKP